MCVIAELSVMREAAKEVGSYILRVLRIGRQLVRNGVLDNEGSTMG